MNCGAPTKNNGTCKQKVRTAGSRCHLHKGTTATTTIIPVPIAPKLPKKKEQLAIVTHIQSLIDCAECCADYDSVTYLNHGSVGVVFTMKHQKTQDTVVLKVQSIANKTKKTNWQQEMKYLQKFSDIGLGVHLVNYCEVSKVPKLKGVFGLLLMEQIHGTLDTYLNVPRTHAELDRVGEEVLRMFTQLESEHVTHGDLALFNIGYNHTPQGIVIRLIDFDDAAIDYCWIQVEVLRVIDALHHERYHIRSDNADYLYEHWKDKWLRMCFNYPDLKHLDHHQLEKEWYKQYNGMMSYYGRYDKIIEQQ